MTWPYIKKLLKSPQKKELLKSVSKLKKTRDKINIHKSVVQKSEETNKCKNIPHSGNGSIKWLKCSYYSKHYTNSMKSLSKF